MPSGIVSHRRSFRLPISNQPTSFWRLEAPITPGVQLDQWPDQFGLCTLSNQGSSNILTSAAAKIGNGLAGTGLNALMYSHNKLNFNIPFGNFVSQDFSIVGWAKLASLPNPATQDPTIFAFSDEGNHSNQVTFRALVFSNEWRLYWADVANAGLNAPFIGSVANGGSLSTATWYFVVVRYNSSTRQLSFSINNGAPGTAIVDASGLYWAIFENWSIGGWTNLTHTQWNGLIDAVGWWKGYRLTDAEVTALWNSGNGLEY